jgi:hypothetical protein
MGGDAALGFRYFSLQMSDRSLLCLAGLPCDIANPEPGDFQSLYGLTVLLELNPVPSDVAVALSDHVSAVISMIGNRRF